MMRALLLAALAACPAAAAQPGAVVVSAAASLTDVMRQFAAIYEGRAGERVVLNLAASNTLARQIAAGARVDVFVSADEVQMDGVAAHLADGSRLDLLSNQLAVAVPADRPSAIRSVADLGNPAVRRIAIGDPAAVPAGVYARAYLQRIDLWEVIATKVVPTGSVRLALAAVENGVADAAIVYGTDIVTARRARAAFVVPAHEGPRIVYPAAALRNAANPAGAQRFLALLQSGEGAQIFERAGFTPLVRRRAAE